MIVINIQQGTVGYCEKLWITVWCCGVLGFTWVCGREGVQGATAGYWRVLGVLGSNSGYFWILWGTKGYWGYSGGIAGTVGYWGALGVPVGT